MSTASEPEKTFLASLALIDRIISIVSRRHAMDPADTDEFAAWVKARIVDSDYAVFRKFGGRSALSSYLTVVISNLFRDYRNARWGRWRPSAEAKRRGAVAIRLEELIYRDGHSRREAIQILLSSGVASSESELTRLATALPSHFPAAEVDIDTLERDPTLSDRMLPSSFAERADLLKLEDALRSLMEELPPEDSLILRMRFWTNMSVADVARVLHVEQKPLYRRIEGIQSRLRRALESRGVDGARVRETLEAEFP